MQRLETSICNTVEKNSCCCCCFLENKGVFSYLYTIWNWHKSLMADYNYNSVPAVCVWTTNTITARLKEVHLRIKETQSLWFLTYDFCGTHCYCFISIHASNDTPEERSADLLKDQQRSQISQRCSTPHYVQQTQSVFHNASVCSPSRDTSARSIPTRPNQKESTVPLACQQGREAIHTEPSTMRRGLCDSRCQNNRKRSGRNSQSYLLLFQREGN